MKNYKSIICIAAAVCLLGTAAFCGFRIYHHYAQVDLNRLNSLFGMHVYI